MELVQLSKFDCVVAHKSFLFSLLLCLLCCSTSSRLLPHLLPISFCFFALVLLVVFFLLQRVVFLVQILASITHLTRKKGITSQRELLQQKVAMVAPVTEPGCCYNKR